MALIVFAVCLAMGMQAENTFETTVTRALEAMAVTLGIGLVVGAMAQRMLEENAAGPPKNPEIPEAKPDGKDR